MFCHLCELDFFFLLFALNQIGIELLSNKSFCVFEIIMTYNHLLLFWLIGYIFWHVGG
jgi:hypothetical protein